MKRKAKRIVPHSSEPAAITITKTDKVHDGSGTAMPPTMDVVRIYFDQKDAALFTEQFYQEHESRQWKTPTGGIIKNWKVCAAEWIYNHRQEMKRRFRQSPFYSDSL